MNFKTVACFIPATWVLQSARLPLPAGLGLSGIAAKMPATRERAKRAGLVEVENSEQSGPGERRHSFRLPAARRAGPGTERSGAKF